MLWLLYNASTPAKYCDILYTVKSHRNPNRTTNTEYLANIEMSDDFYVGTVSQFKMRNTCHSAVPTFKLSSMYRRGSVAKS